MNNGTSRSPRRIRRLAIALLLAGTAVPANAGSAEADSAAQDSALQQHQDIVVTGQMPFPDVLPERDLDETAIESYGTSTVDELLANIQAELGDEDDPLILVNGVRINNLDEIGAFPVEVLRNVQVLPRGSAVRAGGTSGQRVVSLTLKRQARTLTVTAAPKFATEGDWHAIRGETIFTHVRGQTRANVAFRVRDESSLLESERGLIQPDPRLPFATTGNVVGFPNTSGEIDPLLSALAGDVVLVAPFPASSSPTLADFAAGANDPETTDLGEFRTLRPQTHNYDLNGTFSTRIAPWLSGSATLRLNRSRSRSLRGLPSAVFVLGDTNPASPFSTDVGLALYGRAPLRSHSRRDTGEGNVTLNGTFGPWVGNFNFRHGISKNIFTSQRQSEFGSIDLSDAVNPFATDLTDLIGIRADRSTTRAITNLADLTFTGPLVALPAGPLQATIEGRLASDNLHSKSTFSILNPESRFKRSEQTIRGAIDMPFTSRANGVLASVGDISATAEYSRSHFSDAGSLDHYALGLTWEPIPEIRLRGAVEQTKSPSAIQQLGEAVVAIPDVRVFDPLTGETVDVTQISGGNPSLKAQKVTVRRLNALLRLVPPLNLQLNAEYTDTDARNFVSSLPDASAAIMLAFPERFVRDSNGTLTTVDLRPVNFDSHREKRLRWGISMNTKLAGEAQGIPVKGRSMRPGPSTFLQLTANHTIVFSDKILIRPGLDPVDLLSGGAIGIGGGRLRHQLDGTAAITSGGTGLRLGVTWRGRSSLDSRIAGNVDTLRFSPVFLLNLRAFTDARRFLPHSHWAKGLRLSVDLVNLTNDRQRVRDSFGNTPLQYQPAYRDPLGRTIEFEIRKIF
jgi:iron complex outermembrane recepter protein